jgi:hypothetical protein
VGWIVFSTIIENIKSFFAREEELSAKPKAFPEAASDVFERPKEFAPQTSAQELPGNPARIVDRQLPAQRPTLPFSPDELRAAARRQLASATMQERSAPNAPSPPQVQSVEQHPAQHAEPLERDLTHEIAAFERALTSAGVEQRGRSGSRSSVAAIPIVDHPPQEGSFFDEFEQFLAREDLQAETVLGQDVLWRMKEFHRHKLEGKEYYLVSRDAQAAVQRKLSELKELEHEWFSSRAQADQLDKQMQLIERDIEVRVADLRQIVAQSKGQGRLERKVPHGQEFWLIDGRKLSSMVDLRLAMRTMSENTFSYHCNERRNDFASWVRGALGDDKLAEQLMPIKSKAQFEAALSKL